MHDVDPVLHHIRKAVESRGQKEFFKTILAKRQLKNRCWRES
jgi:hypothetical protein